MSEVENPGIVTVYTVHRHVAIIEHEARSTSKYAAGRACLASLLKLVPSQYQGKQGAPDVPHRYPALRSYTTATLIRITLDCLFFAYCVCVYVRRSFDKSGKSL